MGALVGVDRFEVDDVAHDVELIRDAVAAEHCHSKARTQVDDNEEMRRTIDKVK